MHPSSGLQRCRACPTHTVGCGGVLSKPGRPPPTLPAMLFNSFSQVSCLNLSSNIRISFLKQSSHSLSHMPHSEALGGARSSGTCTLAEQQGWIPRKQKPETSTCFRRQAKAPNPENPQVPPIRTTMWNTPTANLLFYLLFLAQAGGPAL